MFRANLFITAYNLETTQMPPPGEWVHKLQYVHTDKRDMLFIHATTQMNIKYTAEQKNSDTKGYMLCVYLYHNLGKTKLLGWETDEPGGGGGADFKRAARGSLGRTGLLPVELSR